LIYQKFPRLNPRALALDPLIGTCHSLGHYYRGTSHNRSRRSYSEAEIELLPVVGFLIFVVRHLRLVIAIFDECFC